MLISDVVPQRPCAPRTYRQASGTYTVSSHTARPRRSAGMRTIAARTVIALIITESSNVQRARRRPAVGLALSGSVSSVSDPFTAPPRACRERLGGSARGRAWTSPPCA
jgi:hypothetical protein